MRELRLGPEEVIFHENEQVDRLYFIVKGCIELFVPIKSKSKLTTVIRKLEKGKLLIQKMNI